MARPTALSRFFAVAVVTLVAGACKPLDDVMVFVFGRSMRDQVSFDPYENPRPAPEGSVPFAFGNFPAEEGQVNIGQPEILEDAPPPFTQMDLVQENAVVTGLINPVSPTERSLDRGRDLFLRFCAPCHGPDGSGVSGYILPAGYPPFPLISDRVRAFPDGYIYGMIRVGRGLMPAYGPRVSHFDRWHIVNYVRELQGVLPTRGEPGTPPGSE